MTGWHLGERPPKVSIIIVSQGKNDYLWQLLDSIAKQAYNDYEVIIIDNSLNPRFSQEISNRHPAYKLYSASENLFYCQALNKGIMMSKGEYLLCLNDDIILDKEFIEKALKGFSVDKKIGMVSGKILRSDGKTIDSTGLFLSGWRTAQERGYGRKDKGQFERMGYIFGVNGAVAFYRREMLEQVKLGTEYFDTDFGFFYEDLDIAWRAQRLDWRGYYVPGAIAYHVRGGTARKDRGLNKRFARRFLSDGLHFDLIKNRYLAIAKNDSLPGFLMHLPLIIFYDLLAWAYILFFRASLIKKMFQKRIPLGAAFKKRKSLGTFLDSIERVSP